MDKDVLNTITIRFLNPRKLGVTSVSRLKQELRALECIAAICRYLDEVFLVLGPVAAPLALSDVLRRAFPSAKFVAASLLAISGGLKLRAIDAIEVSASAHSEK